MANGWQYQSAKGLVVTLTILFAIVLLLVLVISGCLLAECVAMKKNINAGGNAEIVDPAVALAHFAAGGLWFLFYLISVVVFCVWIYRANCNARAWSERFVDQPRLVGGMVLRPLRESCEAVCRRP